MVGTDYLFMLFPILLALLVDDYAKNGKWTTLTLIALTASLAMLLRYLGYALVLTALRGATPAKSGFVAGRATQRLTVSPGVASPALR